MRDKVLYISATKSNKNNEKFVVPYMTTKYRETIR
jgi:hypothetical protein